MTPERLRGLYAVRCEELEAEVARLTLERDTARVERDVAARDGQHAYESMLADRDRLAAALAEVREVARLAYLAIQTYRVADRLPADLYKSVQALAPLLAATPADLATARDARVRAEALREAAALRSNENGDGSVPCWLLRAEAERIERGGR